MEAICFDSIAGYLLCTDRITFIDPLHAVPNYVVVMFMFVFFFLFSFSYSPKPIGCNFFFEK